MNQDASISTAQKLVKNITLVVKGSHYYEQWINKALGWNLGAGVLYPNSSIDLEYDIGCSLYHN